MDTHLQRLLKREQDIVAWLKENKLDFLLKQADQILNDLPREEIKKEFYKGIESAMQYCVENDEIKALDFEWYYAGNQIMEAFAYGLDSCTTEGALAKSDLGPDQLSGIELELEHGDLVDEQFSGIPVYTAINEMVEKINPVIKKLYEEQEDLVMDIDTLITDYFQIWNYKIGYEACEQLKGSKVALALQDRAPFWVTMTRHGRWSVAIMLID